MIDNSEIEILRHCADYAISNGASQVRATLNKAASDSYTFINGEFDKLTHSSDNSIYIYLFVDERYGTFSTNRLDKDELEKFIRNAIDMVRMLGKDIDRSLPAPELTAEDGTDYEKAGVCDNNYDSISEKEKYAIAEQISLYKKTDRDRGEYQIILEECEYADCLDETYIVDSNGFEGCQRETMFSCMSEITIQDRQGNKYTDYWWESTIRYADLKTDSCAETALKRATAQICPQKKESGQYRMVVDRTVAQRLVSPLISALNASSIQQNMSFLADSIEQKIFPEEFTLMDEPRVPGKTGARLFDSEGVATKNTSIIEKGRVKQYFVSTYMANKMKISPTINEISRAYILPFIKDKILTDRENLISLKDILDYCGEGIYVTGFNGGNTNPTNGDFSFAVEGYYFADGKICHPVREMLITGNLIELWNKLTAAGSDSRSCTKWQIPSLAFDDVVFSA